MNKEKAQKQSKTFKFIKSFTECFGVLLPSCDEISFHISLPHPSSLPQSQEAFVSDILSLLRQNFLIPKCLVGPNERPHLPQFMALAYQQWLSLCVCIRGGLTTSIFYLSSDLTKNFQKLPFPSLLSLDLGESSPQQWGLCFGEVFSHQLELNIRMSFHLKSVSSRETCPISISIDR